VSEEPAVDDVADRPRRGLAGRVVDVVVGPFVQPVVDAVDVGDVVDRIDVDELIGRIDVDELLGRIDVEALIARIDLDGLIARVDLEAVIDRIDLDKVLDSVDPDRLLDRVDPDRLLDRVDPNRLLDRVDPNQLLDRVDPDRLLARVDFDAVVERVDVNAVMDRVDVNALVSRTELGEVIARSTTGVFGQLLDAARIAVMALDLTLHGLAARALRRDDPTAQFGPEHGDDQAQMWSLPPQDRAVALQGRYAGAVSRFLAFLVDATLSGALFGLIGVLLVTALQIVANVTWDAADHRMLVGVAYVSWQFTYFAGLTAITGRTIGKAVLGVFVVRPDGTRVTARAAAMRTLAFPLSFLLFGVGFFVGVIRRDRRELHDLIGGTAVVYAWDAETARLRSGSPPAGPM
jgi:uncharacterized RDD family membrane protein YckC